MIGLTQKRLVEAFTDYWVMRGDPRATDKVTGTDIKRQGMTEEALTENNKMVERYHGIHLLRYVFMAREKK